MKATLNPSVLSKELKKMSLIVNKNNIIPITSGVVFEFSKDKLKLVGTDLETTYITEVDCKCSEDFSFVIDYTDAVGIFSSVVDNTAIERKDNNVVIKSGSAKFNLGVLAEGVDFPAMPEDDYDFNIEVEEDFFYHLSNANTRKSKDLLKVNYNLAAIRFFKDRYDVCGTDGFTVYKKNFEGKNKKEFSVMVSDRFVSICKLFQNTTLHFGDKYIMAKTGTDVIISRLSEHKYVNIDQLIPSEIDYNITFNKDELKKSLSTISIAANNNSRQCVLTFNDGSVNISAQDIDYNKKADISINVAHNVTIPSICLNSQYFIQLLSLIDDSEVSLCFSAENRSIYLKPTHDESIIVLIQPIAQLK